MILSIEVLVTAIASILASSGLWAYLQAKGTKKSAVTKLLLGLAHDRIVSLGLKYIDRGWLTRDEYEDFVHYLYEPYSNFGGNGLAVRVKNEVDTLPIRQQSPLEEKEGTDGRRRAVED